MRLQDAVVNTNDVRDYYQPGLQALTEKDRNRLSCQNPRKISGSLNLDAAVAQLYPNAARWDYGIGIKKTEAKDEAIWVEVHPADANQEGMGVSVIQFVQNMHMVRLKKSIEKTRGVFERSMPDDFVKEKPAIKKLVG